MKRLLAAMFVFLAVATPAAAEVRSVQICKDTTLNASTTTDCAYTDISAFKFFSYQFRCNSASTTISINVDWIGGSAAGSAYLAVPQYANGTAMTQLNTTYTTESTTTWSTLRTIQPPPSPIGSIRITNNASTADVICQVILNMGN
jgi:hypothetical protein